MSWTGPEFARLLATDLEARPGIGALNPKLQVVTWEPSIDEPGDFLILGFEIGDTSYYREVAAPPRSHEEVTVRCAVTIRRPGTGRSGAAKDAADRAEAILGEVHTQLRDAAPRVGTQTANAHIARREYSQFPAQERSAIRVAHIEFDIEYTARIP